MTFGLNQDVIKLKVYIFIILIIKDIIVVTCMKRCQTTSPKDNIIKWQLKKSIEDGMKTIVPRKGQSLISGN